MSRYQSKAMAKITNVRLYLSEQAQHEFPSFEARMEYFNSENPLVEALRILKNAWGEAQIDFEHRCLSISYLRYAQKESRKFLKLLLDAPHPISKIIDDSDCKKLARLARNAASHVYAAHPEWRE